MLKTACLLSAVLLLGPARSQNQEPAGIQEPILSLVTNADWVTNALGSIGLPIEVDPDRELEPGHGLRIVLGREGDPGYEPTELGDDVLRLDARPGPLLDRILESELAGVSLGLLRGMFTVTLVQQGMSAKEAASFYERILNAPRQIDRLQVRAQQVGPGATEVQAFLDPVPGTWFAQVCAALSPNPSGCPVLRDPEAVLSLSMAVDPRALPELWSPYHEFAVALATREPAERQELTTTLRQALNQLDGTMAVSMDHRTSAVTQLIGIRDAENYRTFMGGAAYQRLSEQRTGGQQLMSVRRMPSAFKHRGIELARSALRLDLDRLGVDAGSLGEDPILVYQGLVGGYELSAQFDPDFESDGVDRVKKLVDRVLDGRIRRFPVQNDALLHLEMRIDRILALLDEAMGRPGFDLEGAPQHAVVDVVRKGAGLQLLLQLR